ncbi:MAG: tetratricopeptide repeat protein, partial [Gemmatimonadetes bacterium]|nr:tetratricopeptide repeat protein [Gemmatimonadota bacterium]NIQ53748.1 tetratricopeptide repeat protein [Gemmatimonadota bacterium]NIU73923.1 tetratricopeptide repeat protein [Gammaproteobacteria bacterium]NIX43996.1 tetratricopeptide repeat protein [Gemmatimonadota bacterium]NIY08207.1 tetratricopeptide repeat protein [Gemmatimonadota bacterium]
MASTNRDEISRLELLHAAHPDGLVFPHLADAYRRAGRYAQAESVLTAGLRRHADFSSAHLVLARLRLDQGKREEAATAFRRVLQLDPRNMVALEFLGRIAAEDDRPADALQYFRRLYELKPKERIAEQIRGLERNLRSDAAPTGRPEGPEAGGNGGSGDPSDRRGGSPEPGEVVTETMAELYARQGLYGRAVAVYRQLLERKPGDTRLRAKLEAAEARREPDERAGDVGPAPVERPVTGRSTSPAVGEPATIREGLRTLLAWRPRPDPAAAPVARRSHDHVAEPWAEAAVSEPAAPPAARPWREAPAP